ncbi:hypothetical protein BST61_g9848 [Cercospora zeina]
MVAHGAGRASLHQVGDAFSTSAVGGSARLRTSGTPWRSNVANGRAKAFLLAHKNHMAGTRFAGRGEMSTLCQSDWPGARVARQA